ncbi:hypothetical protein FAZ15_09980 [Sphingobacterium olei]|uniref:Uncharacterized protein n=1 Tax=Sphingobacterium olei TaxID=2571155 RepID=A0A4U0P2S7_9SPHI|nr:hypothetical protein [Sphingobacterium olei]TJZ61509.1 hypothetical protein FAZ15_09980 [Sphingobacterium olei]
MKKLTILMLITAFLFPSCDSKTERKTTGTPPTQEGIAKDSSYTETNKGISNSETDLLARLPVRDLPIMDSTSFDNFEKYGIRDNGFLKRIKFDPRRKEANNFRLNYKIPLSENFTSVVISYQCGEHELFTTLITINKDNKIIDKLEIAYDEIAESAFGKTSKIEKDKIMVTSSNWMSEVPVFETETYILEYNGKFKKIKS